MSPKEVIVDRCGTVRKMPTNSTDGILESVFNNSSITVSFGLDQLYVSGSKYCDIHYNLVKGSCVSFDACLFDSQNLLYSALLVWTGQKPQETQVQELKQQRKVQQGAVYTVVVDDYIWRLRSFAALILHEPLTPVLIPEASFMSSAEENFSNICKEIIKGDEVCIMVKQTYRIHIFEWIAVLAWKDKGTGFQSWTLKNNDVYRRIKECTFRGGHGLLENFPRAIAPPSMIKNVMQDMVGMVALIATPSIGIIVFLMFGNLKRTLFTISDLYIDGVKVSQISLLRDVIKLGATVCFDAVPVDSVTDYIAEVVWIGKKPKLDAVKCVGEYEVGFEHTKMEVFPRSKCVPVPFKKNPLSSVGNLFGMLVKITSVTSGLIRSHIDGKETIVLVNKCNLHVGGEPCHSKKLQDCLSVGMFIHFNAQRITDNSKASYRVTEAWVETKSDNRCFGGTEAPFFQGGDFEKKQIVARDIDGHVETLDNEFGTASFVLHGKEEKALFTKHNVFVSGKRVSSTVSLDYVLCKGQKMKMHVVKFRSWLDTPFTAKVVSVIETPNPLQKESEKTEGDALHCGSTAKNICASSLGANFICKCASQISEGQHLCCQDSKLSPAVEKLQKKQNTKVSRSSSITHPDNESSSNVTGKQSLSNEQVCKNDDKSLDFSSLKFLSPSSSDGTFENANQLEQTGKASVQKLPSKNVLKFLAGDIIKLACKNYGIAPKKKITELKGQNGKVIYRAPKGKVGTVKCSSGGQELRIKFHINHLFIDQRKCSQNEWMRCLYVGAVLNFDAFCFPEGSEKEFYASLAWIGKKPKKEANNTVGISSYEGVDRTRQAGSLQTEEETHISRCSSQVVQLLSDSEEFERNFLQESVNRGQVLNYGAVKLDSPHECEAENRGHLRLKSRLHTTSTGLVCIVEERTMSEGSCVSPSPWVYQKYLPRGKTGRVQEILSIDEVIISSRLEDEMEKVLCDKSILYIDSSPCPSTIPIDFFLKVGTYVYFDCIRLKDVCRSGVNFKCSLAWVGKKPKLMPSTLSSLNSFGLDIVELDVVKRTMYREKELVAGRIYEGVVTKLCVPCAFIITVKLQNICTEIFALTSNLSLERFGDKLPHASYVREYLAICDIVQVKVRRDEKVRMQKQKCLYEWVALHAWKTLQKKVSSSSGSEAKLVAADLCSGREGKKQLKDNMVSDRDSTLLYEEYGKTQCDDGSATIPVEYAVGSDNEGQFIPAELSAGEMKALSHVPHKTTKEARNNNFCVMRDSKKKTPQHFEAIRTEEKIYRRDLFSEVESVSVGCEPNCMRYDSASNEDLLSEDEAVSTDDLVTSREDSSFEDRCMENYLGELYVSSDTDEELEYEEKNEAVSTSSSHSKEGSSGSTLEQCNNCYSLDPGSNKMMNTGDGDCAIPDILAETSRSYRRTFEFYGETHRREESSYVEASSPLSYSGREQSKPMEMFNICSAETGDKFCEIETDGEHIEKSSTLSSEREVRSSLKPSCVEFGEKAVDDQEHQSSDTKYLSGTILDHSFEQLLKSALNDVLNQYGSAFASHYLSNFAVDIISEEFKKAIFEGDVLQSAVKAVISLSAAKDSPSRMIENAASATAAKWKRNFLESMGDALAERRMKDRSMMTESCPGNQMNL